jgi:hypothetical protein
MKPNRSAYAARELAWADIQMKLDIMESRIAAASLCHAYFVKYRITTELLAALRRIAEGALV